MDKKVRVSFRIHSSLKEDLHVQLIKDGYGIRGKSKWMVEAIERLLEIENFAELVNLSNEMHNFEHRDTIIIPYQLKIRLDKAVTAIRLDYPLLEGVMSRIYRTAIIQRFLRSKYLSDFS